MSEQVTFPITVGTNDGRTKRLDTTYPPTAGDAALTETGLTFLQTYNTFSSPNYDLSESLLRWDTSSLGDGITITAAALRLYRSGAGGGACTIYADWTAGGAIASGDWIDIGSSPHDANAGVDTDTLTVNADSDIALLNPNSRINKTGHTGLRLIIIPDSEPPVGDNTIFLAAYSHATLPEPRLVVTYVPNTAEDAPHRILGFGAA